MVRLQLYHPLMGFVKGGTQIEETWYNLTHPRTLILLLFSLDLIHPMPNENRRQNILRFLSHYSYLLLRAILTQNKNSILTIIS